MPSYGEKQQPAGYAKKCGCGPVGTRVMMSNKSNVTPVLKTIDNIPYKGNAVLNANRS
tara:strand:+ start:2106 stop:2279 length:174 start_codon:yes stop_codon:yes gene_type:complete